MAPCAEAKTRFKAWRMQWPTGQAALGFRGGVAKAPAASTARKIWATLHAPRRSAQAGAGPGAFARVHQFGPLQGRQQPPDDDRIGVDAAGQKGGGHAVALLVSQDGHQVNGHGKTAACSHILPR